MKRPKPRQLSGEYESLKQDSLWTRQVLQCCSTLIPKGSSRHLLLINIHISNILLNPLTSSSSSSSFLSSSPHLLFPLLSPLYTFLFLSLIHHLLFPLHLSYFLLHIFLLFFLLSCFPFFYNPPTHSTHFPIYHFSSPLPEPHLPFLHHASIFFLFLLVFLLHSPPGGSHFR